MTDAELTRKIELEAEISQFTEQQIEAEIWQILEVEIMKRKSGAAEIRRLRERLVVLLEKFPEGANRDKVIRKVKDKQRYCYLINDSGILDFTGYGGNFW